MSRSIGSVYVDVEANTRKFTRESQRAAQRAGTRAGNTWGERFAQGRDRKADWNQWGAKTVGTSRKYGGLSGSGFGDSFKKRLNIDGRHIFSDVLGSAGRFGAQTARFWSDAFRVGVGQVSEHLLGSASKAAAKAEFASWGTALGKLWTRMFKANASAEAPRVDHDTLDAFLSGVAQGKAYKRGLESAAKMGVSLSDLAGLSPELARLRGYMMGKELGEGVQDGVKAKSRGAKDGFSYGRAFTRFAKIAMPTNWLPKRMDSTVRAVILSLVAAGGPLVAMLSQLSAGLVALGSAVGVAAVGLGGALLPAIMALVPAVAVLGIGLTALSEDAEGLSPAVKGMVKDFKAQWQELRTEVANNLFEPMVKESKRLFENFAVVLKPIATVVGNVLAGMARAFNDLPLERLTSGFAALIESFGGTFADAMKPFAQFLLAAQPAAMRLADALGGIVDRWAAWMDKPGNMKAIAEFLDRALDLGAQLGDVLKPFGSALIDIMDVATKGPAQALLAVLGQLAEQFKAFTSSPEGQKALKAWFGSIAVLVRALLPVFKGLGEGIKRMVTPAAEKALIGLGEAVGALLPLIGTLFNSLAESGILDVFTGLIVELARVLESSGLMDAFAALAAAIGDSLASMMPVVVRLFEALAPIVVILAEALAELLPPLVDALLPVFEGIADTLVDLAPLFGELLEALIPLVKPLMEPLGELMKVVGENTDILIPLVRTVVDIFKAWTPILVPLVGLIGDLIGLVTEISKFFGDLGRQTMEAVGAFAEMVLQSDIVQGVLEGIGSAIDSVSGFIKTAIDWVSDLIDALGRIRIPDVLGTIQSTISNIGSAIGNLLPFASGGVVLGPTRALIGEAGPEAVIPLTRPLAQVDPSVRAMAALLRGEAGYAGVQTKATSAGPVVNVYPTQSDPEAVAYSVANRLAVMAG